MLDLGDRTSIYQPAQEGLAFPWEPEHSDPAEERLYRKRHLAAACRAFAQHGFDYGFAGHLTVRDPERPDLYWTNPMCVHFDQVRVSNLILVDHEGTVVEGSHAVNRAGFVLHAKVHDAHPDILAMCHAHTPYGTAWCATGLPIEPITQDACAFFEDHVVIGDHAGQVAVEENAGTDVAAAFAGVKAALHQNHGLLTASRHSIDAAAFWFIALERCCQQQLALHATPLERIRIPAERARYSREHVGSEYIGWLHFQTLYAQLEATRPDFLD
ncbi:class II aldolase/adducin family protein [Jannaschia sp. Os4]|uniref:class II aldolase/adducin family protein n=1 Tax=Jannaschia sp. Os4 TaxID=2807617 RepID=UPI001939CC08|nr:class II aldolase/adducin family protein [Jannaschia sp. Os4]MBM2575939.1 class II aldolase/adducin family protein [Jannaschia sp. Os4]